MADETFSTQLELDLDTRKALAQLAALNRKIRAIFGPSILGPIGGVGGGGRGIGVSAGEKRKARADQLLATNTELAAARMAKAAAALNIPGGRGRGPTSFANFGRRSVQGLNSASQNTRGLSLLGAAAGVGSLYSYGRFQSQSIGLAAPIVGASKGSIGFQQALELSRKRYIPKLDEFAAQTPFTLGGDIIPAATTGMNFGLQQKNTPESVAEMVRMLGNMQVATGNRRTMSDLGVILGKGASRGEFAGEEMLQLAEAGINIEEIMREIGGQEFKNFQSGGLAAVYGTNADKMLEAIRTIYLDTTKKGGLVKELSTTLPGATSTFADAVDRFGRRVGKSGEERFGVSGKLLWTADLLNNASQDVIDAFGPLAGAAALVSTVFKGLGVTLQGVLLAVGGTMALKALTKAAGVSFLTGQVVNNPKHSRFNNQKGVKGFLGRAGIASFMVGRGLLAGGLGGLAGYGIARGLGLNEDQQGYAAALGAAGGMSAQLGAGFHKNPTKGYQKAMGAFNKAVTRVTGGLGLVATAAIGAAKGVELLDGEAERHFQAGKGLHWYDELVLSAQRFAGGDDDGFNYRGGVRGNGKLIVEVLDQRVVAKYSDNDTNELVGIPMNGGGYRGALIQ